MKFVKYFPNEADNQLSKHESLSAIAVRTVKKSLPKSKDDKGNVVETTEVDALDLHVLLPEGVLYRQAVVAKKDASNKELNFKLPYYTATKE